jgi:nucleotide-binding universal stress UspA family protein
MEPIRTLLVTTDLSEPSLLGVKAARTLAEQLHAKVVLCYVVEDRLVPLVDAPSFERIVREHRELAEDSTRMVAEEQLAGLEVTVRVRQGVPADEIIAEAIHSGADLIVVSTRGHGMLDRLLLGSTTERVLRRASVPVVVVPAYP